MNSTEVNDALFGQLRLQWDEDLNWWEGSIEVEGRPIRIELWSSKPDEIPEPIRDLFRACQARNFDYRDAIMQSNSYHIWGIDDDTNEHVGEAAFFASVRLASIIVHLNEISLWHEQADYENSHVNLGGHWMVVELTVDGTIHASIVG